MTKKRVGLGVLAAVTVAGFGYGAYVFLYQDISGHDRQVWAALQAEMQALPAPAGVGPVQDYGDPACTGSGQGLTRDRVLHGVKSPTDLVAWYKPRLEARGWSTAVSTDGKVLLGRKAVAGDSISFELASNGSGDAELEMHGSATSHCRLI